jgi:flagellar basal body P-ring formation protein FlgA
VPPYIAISMPKDSMNNHLRINVISRLIVTPFLVVLLALAPAFAQPDPTGTRQRILLTAQAFLDAQPTDGGTHRKVTIGQPDLRALNIQCTAFEAFLPVATRLWGSIQIGIRCASVRNWQIFIPAEVAVHGKYLAAARLLNAGETIGSSDFVERNGELTRLPVQAVSHPGAVLGKTLTATIFAGQPIRSDFLRVVPSIQSGQPVRVLVKGQGFQVESEGRAIGQAGEGQVAQVRLVTGQIVSGIAHKGSLIVSFLEQ